MIIAFALLAVCMLVMLLTWYWQLYSKNAGWVDVVWSALLGFLAVSFAVLGDGSDLLRWLTALMGGIWSLRLTSHLYVRVAGEPEDGRYQAMRGQWGQRQQMNLLWFFQVQALIAWLFGWVFWATANNTSGWSLWVMLALLVWAVSIAGENLADRQLAKFKRRPESKGKTCREGLWRYSRHPNYFFEWLHWCSYPLLAVGSGYWWVALLGPVVMFMFLYRVTGIPYTEQQALKSRGDDYRRYQQTTSAFFPWPPKSQTS